MNDVICKPFLFSLRKAFLFSAALASCLAQAQTATVFPSAVAVGKASVSQTVTVHVSATDVVASTAVITQGSLNAEFAVSDAGTCSLAASLTAGGTCTLSVVFQPKFPGLRRGAINVIGLNGELMGQALLAGSATGPLAVLSPGVMATVAGDGDWTFAQDGVTATLAPIFLPTSIVEDAAGNLYLSDSNNNRVRRVDAVSGLISTVAGNGNPGFSGDGGPATSAMISAPVGLALDGAGNLYFVDSGNMVVRRVDVSTGIITTIAGTGGAQGYSGDGSAANLAKLSLPEGLAMDAAGNLYIADTGNNAVRKVDASTGLISTIAGGPNASVSPNGVPASKAILSSPWGITIGLDGSLYIADFNSNRVLKINTAGTISIVAGTGSRAFAGDGNSALAASLNAPAAVAVDPAGNIYIADSGNNRIREVTIADGNIATISGSDSEQFLGDGMSATVATFYAPYSLYFDQTGNLLIADMFHNRIRRISATAIPLSYATIRVSKTSPPQAESVANDGNADLHLSPYGLINAALDPASTTCVVSTDGTSNAITSGTNCSLGVEFAPTVVGDLIYGYVTVASDAANAPNVITLSGEVLTVNPTSVAVASDNNPSLLQSTVDFTATISSSDTALSGTVDFLDGSTVLCHAVTVANNAAACSTSALTLGQHNITASYTGDSNNAAAVSVVLLQVVKQPSTLTLGATPNPAVVTNSVALSVTATAATGTPSGVVTFYDGSTAIGSANLTSAGTASFATTSLTAGNHNLTAKYAGDTANAATTSNTVSEVINLGPTATMLATNNSIVAIGTTISFTATVHSTAGLSPTGTVAFMEGTTTLGSSTLANGSASFSISTLTPGTHNIVASYQGDTQNATSNSSALAQTIQQIATATTIIADSNPISAGAAVQLTAKVTLGTGAVADGDITGQVTFTDSSTTLGTATLDATGTATLLTRTLTVGPHTIVASYAGNTNYAASNSTGLSETVNSTATTTVLSAGSAGAISGEAVTLTANISSKTGIPTGAVTFFDGANSLGQSTLNAQGVATFTSTTFSTGTHSLTAVYAGDSNYNTSTSNALSQLITIGTLTLTLSGPAGPVNVGTAAVFNVSLTTNGVAPTGTLSLLDGSNVIGTQTLTGTGTFTFSISTLALGTHSITASYAGDTHTAPASTTAFSLIVQQAATSTTLQTSANPVTLGQNLTLSAAVTSVSASITGSVNFYDGATLLGSSALGANGTATFNTSSLTAGTHVLTATYAGDTNHAASTSPSLSESVVQSVQIGLTSSVNPAIAGSSVTFALKLAGSGSLVPTGTINLLDGQTLLSKIALDATGAASFSTTTLTVGTHNLTATYAGDANYAAGTSGLLVQTVSNANTQITLSSSANPATFGSPLTLQAVVKSNGGAASGSITFTEGGTLLGSAILDANGAAALTLSTLAPGTHSIIANYAGDGAATGSVSSPLSIVVKQTATVALASSSNPASTLSPVTFTATVANAGQTVPTGTILFSDGATQLGSVTLDATGSATLTVPSLVAGSHSILAVYSGDLADFTASSPTIAQSIQLRTTTTALTATPDPSNSQGVVLIGVVRWTGSVVPTGIITFTNGSATLGSVAVDNTGVATLPINVGNSTESIIATYAGDASYAGSASSATTVGSGTATQFTVALSPNTMSFQSKQHATTTLTVGSLSGFSDTLSFGCLGLPTAATCTFSKTQMALTANGTISVQLTVDTGNPLGAGGVASNTHSSSSSVLLCFLPGIAFAGFGLWKSRKRSRLMTLALILLCGGIATSLTGCGGLTINGTPAGTYKFQVTALGQNTGVSESQTMTLTVTQ